MLLEHRSLGAPALAITWLITAAGCALEDEEANIEFRGGPVDADEEDPDSIPGGGPCKRCVRGFRQVGATLELCVDTSVRYVTDPTQTGTALLALLTSKNGSPKWTLVDSLESTKNQCANDVCLAQAEKSSNRYVVAKLPISPDWKPASEPHLILTAFGDRLYGSDPEKMPRLLLTDGDPSSWPCAPGYKAPVEPLTGSAAASPAFVAQIAYPWPGGGVRSCSGALVSPRHILTAAHCFDLASFATDVGINSQIDVRFGNAPWLGDGSVVDVMLHEDYHSSQLDDDLAIVELASDVDPAIKPAILPATGLYTPIGDFWAHGYGVRPYSATLGYDWGTPKTVKMLWSTLPLVGAEHLPQHMHFKHLQTAQPLCQGDSGGPVLSDIDGTTTLVAILAARVGRRAQRSTHEVEPMSGALAFNHGHACGALELDYGYVATPFDDDTLTWIDAQIGVWPPLE